MATALAAQLAQIAAKSKSTLDVKAQRAAHAKSILFEPRVAASQTYPVLYALCYEGFEDLCRIDHRFDIFGGTLFSEQSQHEDRTQLTVAENGELDKKVESFLRLVASRIQLQPALKAIEWLVRRFRIHEFNTVSLLTVFLPHHNRPIFGTLLSILPSTLPLQYRFLNPYVRAEQLPPRAVIVRQAASSAEFLALLSEYTLESGRRQVSCRIMVSFWGGIFTEAIGAMLDKMRSGRAGVQMENDQKLLSQLLPIFNDGLMMTKAPDMQVACYMALSVYVAKGNLSDNVITAMLEQVVAGWSSSTLRPGLVCLSILAHHRSSKQLPWKAAKALLKIPDLTRVLAEVSLGQRTDRLVSGLCLACVERLAKRGDTRGLEIVPLLFDPSILTEKQMISIFKALLSAAHKLSAENDPDGLARKQLSSVILRLSQTSGTTSAVVEKALSAADVDLDDVELRLQTTIRPKQLQQQITEEKSTKTTASKPVESFRQSLEQVAKKRYDLKQSCLSPRAGDVVKDLCAIFESFSLEGAKDTLDEEPIFRECDDRFYVTFFARIWCGPYPSFVRSAALEHVKRRVKGGHPSGTDFQSIYVYLLVALGDTSKKVRRSAADLVTVLSSLWTANGAQTKVEWPGKQLYGEAEQRALSTDVSGRLLQTVLMPSLEECVMHESHIDAVIQQLLDGGSTSSTSDRASGRGDRWAQADLSNIFNFLASHISQTPLLAVKKRILFPLVRVKNTGGTRTNQLLLPILEWWSKLGVAEVAERCREESIEQSAMDTLVADIVTANDKAGLEYLLEIVKMPRSRDRPGLVRAVFGRLKSLFSSMKSETKASTAMSLLEVSLDPQFDGSTVSEEAAGFLKTAGLSTPILSRFLRSIQNSVATVPLDSPPSKRRKTNSSDHAGPAVAESTPDLERALRRATFILELVHDSNPIQHPELFNDLFDTLSDLQHLRSVMGTDLGYLQNLVLSSLLAMMPAYRSDRTLKIDPSGGQGDLLVNCIQKASSPSVQNTALLLVANLATIAPDLVLHSVMPIFAFMESSVLRQNDNYSAHVITQTIKEIIPPLINSLRKGKRNPVTGASELLVSFVTAYEHVPSHRRQGLFKALVETLGPEDFMFAVLAMLVDRYESSETAAFALGLLSSFGVDVQLQTLIRLIDLIAEVFKPKAGIAGALLGAGHDGELDPEEVAETQLGLVAHLLRNRSLASQMAKITAKDDMDASKIRELYASLLERVLIIANTVKPRKSSLHDLCGVALENLLNMLSIGEFIKAVEDLLDRSDTGLRQKVLRALEGRIDREKPGDAQSSTVLLAFLPHLTAVIRDSNDIIYKHTAVGCVDKISEKYGRKDLETVSAAAETIASDNCLGQDDQRLRVISLLCLASLVDVLQDGIVPVLPSAIPKALVYLKESLVADGLQEGLHNSVYAFFTALAEHIPYMVSEAYLVQLMSASNLSAEASWSAEGENARKQCFEFLCKKVDAKVMFHALEKNWAPATSAGYLATKEFVDLLGITISRHPKSVIAKNLVSLSAIFFNAFDLRRCEVAKDRASTNTASPSVDEIEKTVNEVALRMIYKLNDTTFRPVFARLMEWSTALPKADKTGRVLRLQSVYGFCHAFFSQLKSVVTSYASYLVDNAVAVLGSISVKKLEERELWRRVLRTLASSFEHDQDGFWQAPAHFNTVAPVLTEQLSHAVGTGTADLQQDLIAALVELGAAIDSQEQQRALNLGILKKLRSEDAAVRLIAVKTEQALTDRIATEWMPQLPEMLPYISELQEDDDEVVERETHRWIVKIEDVLGESLDAMLQ